MKNNINKELMIKYYRSMTKHSEEKNGTITTTKQCDNRSTLHKNNQSASPQS